MVQCVKRIAFYRSVQTKRESGCNGVVRAPKPKCQGPQAGSTAQSSRRRRGSSRFVSLSFWHLTGTETPAVVDKDSRGCVTRLETARTQCSSLVDDQWSASRVVS